MVNSSGLENTSGEHSLEVLLLKSIHKAIESNNRPYIYMFMNYINKKFGAENIVHEVGRGINEILYKEYSDYLKKEKTRASWYLFLNSFAAYSVLAAYSDPLLKDYKYYSMSLFLLLCFGVIGLSFKIMDSPKKIKNIYKKDRVTCEKLGCDEKALLIVIENSRKQIIKKLYEAEEKLKIGIELKIEHETPQTRR